MALQIHESVGHAIELDRILGWEAAFAGTSWLDPAQLGSMRYGSDLMNITADATLPGALGSFGYDDEGVPAQAVDIVKDGTWVGVLSGRDSAPLVGLTSGGMVRADGAARLPMVRMTNVGLLPGDSSLEEMIAATDDGIYMDTNRSWSIDDKRLNFQFGCEIAWEIKDGQLGQMLRNPTYTGIGPRFWASMDMVGGPDEWVFWGTANCGKGQPIQVGHTGPPVGARPLRRRPGGGALMAWDPGADADRPAWLRAAATACSPSSAIGPRRWSPAGRAPTRSRASPTAASTRTWRATTTTCGSASSSTAVASPRPPPPGSTTTASSAWSRAPSRRPASARPIRSTRASPSPAALDEVDHFDADTAAASPDAARRDRGRLRRRRSRPGVGRLLLHRRRHPRAVLHHRASATPAARRWRRSTPSTAPRPSTGRPPTATARSTSKRIADLDGRRVGDRGRGQGHRRRQPDRARARAPTRWCWRPKAVAAMLLFPAWLGFNGKAHAEGTSFAHLGEQQFDERIDLWDDGTDPRSLGRPYDAEGTPKRRVDLVPTGVTVGLAHDRRSAALAGVESTGSSVGQESFGGYPGDLFLEGGDESPRAAHRRRRAGAARHRLLVQPHPRPQDAGRHRPHPQRPVPHRGRRGHAAGAEPPLHAVGRRRARPRATCSASATTPSSSATRAASSTSRSLRLPAWAFTGNARG